MKSFWNKRRKIFGGLIFLSVFIVFFFWRTFNTETTKNEFSLSWDAVTKFRKWLDVSGGTKLTYRIAYDTYEQTYSGNSQALADVKKKVEDIITENIDSRISTLWVSDYKSYTQNIGDETQVVVEIWWVADLDQAKEIIWKTVELEFKLPNTSEWSEKDKAERTTLAQNLYNDLLNNTDKFEAIAWGRQSENVYYSVYDKVALSELPNIYQENIKVLDETQEWKVSPLMDGVYLSGQSSDWSWNIQNIEINGYTFFRMISKEQWANTGLNLSWLNESGANEGLGTQTLYTFEEVFVEDRLSWRNAQSDKGDILNWGNFKYAEVSTSQLWEPVVVIKFDDAGKEIFCNITSNNIWKQMAIFIWGKEITSPVIQSKICDGSAQIDGSFTPESAKELTSQLNDWALPAPLILMQEEKVSPTLWENALNWALLAMAIGFIAIWLYMSFTYGWKKWLVSLISLTTYTLVLFAVVKIFDYALSLSGIAAVILSIWMAVDANVLIFERMREEKENKKSDSDAINIAYDRSWNAIRDGQISTWMIGLLLMVMWISIFRWFGTMLVVWVLLTLLINAPVIKELLHIFYRKK